VLHNRTLKTSNRANTALRMAAQSAGRSNTAIGAFYRRLKAKHGPAKANVATAHKLARILYAMLKSRQPFVDLGAEAYMQQQHAHWLRYLSRKAKALGMASVMVTAPSLSASPRSGDLQVTKECSKFNTDSFCTILESNLKAIEAGSRIVYLQPAYLFTPEGSDVVLDPPGPGNNTAFGHCSLALGVCTFSGGTGKFTWFHASVAVSHTDDFSLWFWEGTYSFSPQD
jgi:hypothetical protein